MSRNCRGLLMLLAAAAISTALAGAATAAVSPAQLQKAGWTCFLDPGAPRTVCSDPAHGRPPLLPQVGLETYNFKIFSLDGTFIGTSHLIRADLYNQQPCPQTGGLYFFIPPIGYYRCEHF